MRFTKKLVVCLTAMLFILTAAVVAAPAGTTDWGNGTIQVKGNGIGKAKYKNSSPGQYRLTAHQAARMDAQRKLAEYVNGVRVQSQSSMADMAAVDDRVATMLNGTVLRNAIEVGEPEYNKEEGVCTVTMELRMYGDGTSLAAAAFLPFKDEPKVSFPQPVNVSAVNNHYTGLIIDCRGMNINCVMSPVIKNSNGQVIYGYQNLDYDKIIVNGMASYAGDISDSISCSRAGDKPLIIKATKLSDLNANPVVSAEDADKILAANQHDKFLDNCAVVFIK